MDNNILNQLAALDQEIFEQPIGSIVKKRKPQMNMFIISPLERKPIHSNNR